MKRKIALITIMVLMFICLIFSISYAFYNIAPNNKHNMAGLTQIPGCAGLTINNKKNISLEGDYAVPVQDDRLLNSSQTALANYKFNFTINNECTNNANITLALALLDTNTMPQEVIKYLLVPEGTTNLINQIDNVKTLENERILTSAIKEELNLENNLETAFILKTEELNANASKNYDLYVWIDYTENNENNSTMNKTLNAMVILTSYESIGSVYVNAPKVDVPSLAYNQNSIPSQGITSDVIAQITGCSGVSWNNEYQALELGGDVNNCTVSYSREASQKSLLTDYVIALAETTSSQIDWKVVHETFDIGDYTTATALNQSQYGTITEYYNTSSTSTTNTSPAVNAFSFDSTTKKWNNIVGNLTSNKYYHIKMPITEAGYYQFCYEIGTGSTSNYLYLYNNTTQIYINASLSSYAQASSSTTTSKCVDIGYLSAGTQMRVVNRAYTSIASVNFQFKKTNIIAQTIDTGYRYEGENPNNYVWFNNELWQIIGALPVQKDDDANETNLIKLIRKNPIGTYSWNQANTNDWTAGSLYKMLNPVSGDTNTGAYYNGNNNNTYCYGYQNYKKSDCTFARDGITSNNARNMIEKVVWKLGMHDTNSATADTFYQAERGTTVYSGRPTEVSNYIGLMYPSDYGYSVLANNCARTTNLSSYGNTSCRGKAWLFKPYSWTITGSLSSSASAFRVNHAYLNYYNATSNGFSVQPVLYLKSNVYRVSGDGTVDNPYIVAM